MEGLCSLSSRKHSCRMLSQRVANDLYRRAASIRVSVIQNVMPISTHFATSSNRDWEAPKTATSTRLRRSTPDAATLATRDIIHAACAILLLKKAHSAVMSTNLFEPFGSLDRKS